MNKCTRFWHGTTPSELALSLAFSKVRKEGVPSLRLICVYTCTVVLRVGSFSFHFAPSSKLGYLLKFHMGFPSHGGRKYVGKSSGLSVKVRKSVKCLGSSELAQSVCVLVFWNSLWDPAQGILLGSPVLSRRYRRRYSH